MNKDTIEKVRTSIYALTIENMYKNTVCLSGWIIPKPNFFKHDKTGKESVSFIIVQYIRDSQGYAYYKSYSLLSYVTQVIETLKNQKKICYIICDGQVQFSSLKKMFYPQIYDLRVIYSLDLDLESEEQK